MSRGVAEHGAAVAALVTMAASDRSAVTADALAVGDELAADVVARADVPAFDNSQMDGFAVRSDDLAQAPVTLRTTPHVRAGATHVAPLASGDAAPIMTGAPIPSGADAVVPIEEVPSRSFGPALGGTLTTFARPVPPGQFVRRRAVDVRAGDVLLSAGTVLTAAAVGAVASNGVLPARVTAPFRVLVVSTGDEIVNGQVADTNTASLVAALGEIGVQTRTASCGDEDPAGLLAMLYRQRDERLCDLVITTGGISEGAYEVVRQALTATADAWFGHVAMQPGGPQGTAVIAAESGTRGLPVICLPGNPVSVMVSFELFVRPALLTALRRPWLERARGRAELASALDSSPVGKLQVRRGTLDERGRAVLIGGPGSHLLVSYARSSHLFLIPPGIGALDAGDTVEWWRIG